VIFPFHNRPNCPNEELIGEFRAKMDAKMAHCQCLHGNGRIRKLKEILKRWIMNLIILKDLYA